MLLKCCWLNKNSVCKITRNLLLILLINVTTNTEYTINKIALSVPLYCIERWKYCNKHSSSIVNTMHLLRITMALWNTTNLQMLLLLLLPLGPSANAPDAPQP
jgi:hypothetical protein